MNWLNKEGVKMGSTSVAGGAFIVILIIYFYAFSQVYRGELSSLTGLAAIAFGLIVAAIVAAVIKAKT